MSETSATLVPDWLEASPIQRVIRIDLGLEFVWNDTFATIWTPTDGFLGFGRVPERHRSGRHALELYMEDGWIGVHCHRQAGGEYVLEPEKVLAIMDFVAKRLS